VFVVERDLPHGRQEITLGNHADAR
jgi:hypothetical protein